MNNRALAPSSAIRQIEFQWIWAVTVVSKILGPRRTKQYKSSVGPGRKTADKIKYYTLKKIDNSCLIIKSVRKIKTSTGSKNINMKFAAF